MVIHPKTHTDRHDTQSVSWITDIFIFAKYFQLYSQFGVCYPLISFVPFLFLDINLTQGQPTLGIL